MVDFSQVTCGLDARETAAPLGVAPLRGACQRSAL